MHTQEFVLGLVLLALAVASLARWLHLPAPPLLVAAGLLVGLAPHSPAVHLSPVAIATLVLPPLLYAAAADLSLPDLRAVAGPVVTLASGLVAATAVAVAVVVHALRPEVATSAALVLGGALASTDPVAVSALARRLNLPPRLLALVQGESLFNDATSLVFVQVAVAAVVAGGHASALSSVGLFARLGLGGAAIGALGALLAEFLLRRTADPLLEVAGALLVPYVCYISAQALHTSGVTAVVLAGIVMGGRGLQVAAGPTRVRVSDVYAVLVFLLELGVFGLVGLELPGLVRQLPAADAHIAAPVAAVAATVVATRLAWTYPAEFLRRALPTRGRVGRQAAEPVADTLRTTAVLSWAGCRGVLPLVAALSIPLTVHGGAPFPHRALLLVLTTSTVVVTLVVQGLTLEPLVRRLDVRTDPAALAGERSRARRAADEAALARLVELEDLEAAPELQLGWLRLEVQARLASRAESPGSAEGQTGADARGAAAAAAAEATAAAGLAALRRDLLAVQSAELLRLRRDGAIGEATRRELQRALDTEEASLHQQP